MTTVLVTGATGTLGRAVVHLLLAGGYTARALSRHSQAVLPPGAELVVGDLTRSADLTQALTGVEAIIHCATDPKHVQIADMEGRASCWRRRVRALHT